MSTFKATDKKKKREDDVFKATSRKTFDSAYIGKIENQANDSLNILNDYIKKRNIGGYISSKDMDIYEEAFKKYSSSMSTLNGFYKNFGMEHNEEEANNWISSLSKDITNSKTTFSKFKDEHEFNDAVKIGELNELPSTELEKRMGFSRDTYESELAPLKAEYEKLNKDIQFYGRGDKSRFKSAKDYNDAKIRRDELKKQMTDLKGKDGIAYTTSGGQNITWANLYKNKKHEEDFNALYGELSSADGWHEIIKKGEEYQNPSKGEAEPKAIIFGKEVGKTDSPINKVSYFQKYGKEIAFGEANGGGSSVVHSRIGEMTKEEKEVYNYYFGKGEYDKAEKFLDSLESILQDRFESTQIGNVVQLAGEHPIVASGLSVGFNIGSGAEYIRDSINFGTTGNLDNNHSAELSSAIRGTVTSKYDFEVGEWDVFDFLYGTGMSMVDSATSMALFGNAGGVALGLSAAAQGTNDALDRGMSKGQAFASGVASGIFEGVFESWQIGAMGELAQNLKRADFRNLAKFYGKNMWNNAKEEFLTEISNIAYDYFVNGDFSQYETSIRQYMNSGMSEREAKSKVAIELGVQVAEAAGSGALMGLGFGVKDGAIARHNLAQRGRAIKDAGETRNLVELGKSLGEGTESFEAANKIGDKSRALAIGRLMEIVGGDIPNANKVDMIKAFEEKGYNSKEANLLVNKMTEQGLDSVANIRGMRSPTQAYNDVLNDPDSTISQRNEAYRGIGQNVALNQFQRAMGKAVKNKSAVGSHKDLKGEQGKSPIQEENPIESKFESNIEGKDFNSKNDKVITSKKLVSSEKDNMKFEVTYDDGATDTVDANDINFGNEGEALVYSYVMDMNVPVGIAEPLISGYKGNDFNSAGTYINGMREAFVFGKTNQEADLHSGAYASQLTEEQRNSIFKLGGIYAREKAIADEKAIKGETKPSDIKKQEGKVHFEGDKLSLKSVQDVSLESLNVLSKALGKDFHIYESYVDKNGKRVYKDADGVVKKAPNGKYDQKDGSIWIDLNAGSVGQGTMMYTVAHELTHFIKQWSPTKFKALADFLVEQYGKEGVSVHELVLAQQEKAKKNNREISYDVAFEEMVADSMETMLTDGKVIRELAHKDKGLFDKIKSWIDNLLRRLNKEYKNYSPETKEGQMLREMKKTFEEAQRLFTEALTDASDNFAIRGTDVGFIKQNMITETGKLAGVMDSTRTETEAMPKMVMDMSSGNGGKLFTDLATNYLIKGIGNGGAVNGYTVAQIREAIMKANGYNTKEIRNVQAFMKSMADFMNEAGVKYRFIGLKDVENAKLHYSYNADGSIKSVVLSAMVKNGDYPVNFDFSSICKKRVAMSKLINKLCDMGAMDKGTVNLSPKNIFEINKALKNEGFETACLGCFVESKRYNIQEWANSFIKKWNEAVLKVNPNATYFGFTDGKTNFDNLTSNQVFAIDKAAQTFLNKTGQERRNKAKAVYKEKANNGEALLEKLPKSAIEKIKKSQSLDDSMKDYFLSTDPKAFTLADVELLIDNEILAGKSISNKQKIGKMVESGEQFQHLLRPSDLLTERGITQLEQLPNFHGILYGHYGSGTPKLVQGFTPYNSEIALLSEKKGDKTLAEYLYSIAGVRMQSFSDFQIQNIFDYLQMIADLSARKLPAHAYTKEISFAKLLGMTGIKTNLSVMFDIDTSVDDAHAGLTKYNPSIHQGEYAKIVLEDEQGKWVYNIGDYATQKAYENYEKMMGNEPTKRFLQSIGFADAVKLQTTEGYTKNCGIIGVGYSDAHILAMLDDSRIRYVIPYHSSSLPHEIKVATNIEKGTDYTSTQNTMKIKSITDKNGNAVDWSIKEAFKRLNSGKAVIEELNKHIKEDGWVVETKKAQNGHGTFDLYGDLGSTSNPRMTADNFMSWCAKNGSLPLFYQFADHNNYYKMLYDFNVYDNVTEEYAPQGAVTNTYPTGVNIGENVVDGNFNDGFFKETVEHYMQVQNDFNARLDDTIERIADDIVNNTMPDADFGVLNSDRDSEGNTLTKEQQEFFNDSQVRWGENLMPVYHGTRREFTVFDATKGYDENRVGGLLWAAKDYEYAKDYSYSDEPIVMKGYLNITNLLDIGDIDNYADYNKRLQEIADLVKLTPSELEAMATYDDSVKYIYDITSSKGFRDRIVELGYDGVEAQESGLQTFGFVDSNQFKNIDNTNPTSNPDIRYSSRIEVDMSEEKRYEILKDKKIQPQEIEIDKDFDIEFSFLENNIKSIVEKPLISKLQELGYLKKYTSNAIDVEFEFTGSGVRKSIHSQENHYGGNLGDFAKVVLNMQKLLDNSVLLEIHTDKGKGTPRENPQLMQTYVLLSALREGNSIKPVQFEVKQYVDNDNRLYLAVALTKIETGVKGNTIPQNEASTSLLPVSKISIADLFKNVNIKDAKFLKYAPNQFLSEEQIKAKERELAIDRAKYSIKESSRVPNTELASMDDTALYIKNTKKANYIGMIFNGTKTEETRSRRTLDAFIGKDFYVTDGEKVYGSIVLGEPHKYTEEEFHKLENQKKHRVPKGDEYDVKPGGTKWAYPIESYERFDKPKKLSDSKEYANSFQARQVLYSDRDNSSVSTRSLLANALEGAAQNDIEKNKLAQYKEKIALIEAEQNKLHELREKLFTKGISGAERREIQEEATRTANRINTYDRQLFNLEATTALKNVLTREKELARKRQKQKDAENLKAYKEKVAETTRQLLEKNRESRMKAIEGRNKTEMRHKVKKVVNDLNNLLLKPTKERHIPEAMRVAVAEALDIVNMDTVDAETRVARLNEKIAKANDPDIIASLTESRDRILEQGNKLGEKLDKLKSAYGEIKASGDDNVNSMYDDVIYSKIEKVQKDVGKTPLRSMTLEQLESVYELYKMVLTTVRDSNKAFAENLKMTRQALGSNTFAEIKENNKAKDRIKFEGMKNFGWKNLKPMLAMKTIGSDILQKLWNNILYGQEVFAQDYDEAVKFAKETKEKYGYKEWDLHKLYSFESKSGKVMKINLEQMMSIYAYSKRKQADEHIEFGGILLNESIIKEKDKLGRIKEVKVNDSTAYRLNKLQVGEIIDTLEKEFPGAKDFVDEMQKYLSETMGEKGNEVSMKMYGIKLFKEEHYFPLKSSKDFMEAANDKLKGDVKIKNKGMTKSTVEHARNPIVLENFLDVWGNHINEMAMYHGLVLPLEDFSRTLNYGFKADDKSNTDAESVKTALHNAFGESAEKYLNELLKAINGGVLHDSSDGIANKMISTFKKSKVMASLSVIVQQPTAIIRAMGIIDPKYFVAQNFHHKATWEELKKYCPTAIIKETGSFDTNMGRTIVDMIKEDRKFTEKVGDTLGKAPAYMDEMGWNMIWRALKNKVATEQKLSGEELLKECGKQMTLIINETQVYDSVMSRNELMRSKSAFTKMATAFMGEPTTVANMIYGAALDIKRGKIKVASKTVTAVISSVVINGLVSSLVYAFRDDDEEKTWLEKYLSSATTELIDGFNPLTYIPFVKDAYSLFQGYDVERTDMALIGDVVDAIDDFYNVLDPEAYEGMNRKAIAKHIFENTKPLLTSICDMFGLPVGNILRDAEAIIVNDNLPKSKNSGVGKVLAIKEGWLDASPKFIQNFVDDEKYHKLYLIANKGDTEYVKTEVAEMVAEKFDSYKEEEDNLVKAEKKANQSVKSSFTGVYRDNYKKAYKNKDSKEMNEIRKFLYATGLWKSLSELDILLKKWREDA